MDYMNLIVRLEQNNEPLSFEAAKAIRTLMEENEKLRADNNNLSESYEAMFRDLKRAYEKLKIK